MSVTFKIQFSASAGTGKTYQVTQLYLALVLGHPYPKEAGELIGIAPGTIHPGGEPLPCEKILMLTFSRNAAAELRQRITAGIEEARADAEAKHNDEIAARCWNLLHRLPAADISTIHAYAQRLVEQHALRLGLSPAFSILDEDAASDLRQEIFEAALHDALENGNDADHATREALCAGRGASEVLGALQALLQNTRSLGLRLENMDLAGLVEQPAPPTLERLRQLRTQLATANGQNKRGKAPQILADLDGLLATATMNADMVALAAHVAELAEGQWGKDNPALSATRDALQHFGAYAEHRRAADALPPLLHLVKSAAQRYENAKRERAGLDFDDLLLLARDLVMHHAEALPPITAIIVDEAQDNSALQNEFIRGLQAARSAALALCGDWKQTIYAWRNADPQGLERLAKETKLRGVPLRQSFRSQQGVLDWINDFCRGVLFDEAYRADDELLPCPRALATEPPNIELLLPEWELQPDPFEPVGRKMRLELSPTDLKRLAKEESFQGSEKPANGVSKNWKTVLAQSEQAIALEARALARRIELLTAGPASSAAVSKVWKNGSWSQPESPPYRRRDILILLKATSRQEIYEAALRERGIPYTTDGKGRGFLTRQEVQDIASLLSWLAFRDDLVALLAVARSPFCALSDEVLAVLAQGSNATNLAIALTGVDTTAATARLAELGLAAEAPTFAHAVEFFRRMRLLAGRLPPVELVREAIRLTGFDATLAGSFHGAQRLANLKKLLSWIETHERSEGLDLAGVARWLTTEIENGEDRPDAPVLDPQDDAVRINTVHAAKGLTSPVVCLPDLRRIPAPDQQWLLPHPTATGLTIAAKLKTRQPDLPDAPEWNTSDFENAKDAVKTSRTAEDQRLFYVAATRPRDLLVFSGENAHRTATWRGALNHYLLADSERALRLMTLRDYRQLEEEWRAAGLAAPRTVPAGEISATQLAEQTALPERPPHPELYRYSATLLASVPTTDDPAALREFIEEDLAGLQTPHSTRRAAATEDSRAERITTGVRAHAALRAAPLQDSQPATPKTATASALAWLRKNCGDLPPAHVLRELPFVARFSHDGAVALVDGAADLVFWRNGAWHIVDYKFTEQTPDELRQRYALQLAIYAAALFTPDGLPRFAHTTNSGALGEAALPKKGRVRSPNAPSLKLSLLRCSRDFQCLEIPFADFPSLGKTAAAVIATARILRKFQPSGISTDFSARRD
ncbi:MAG: hypothetical protein EPN23_09280 [Verrucomicrobia bacterium]|nr:MAG: hypothetical protein EPN23_09280 [Verrucomicrobiota bacterium]